VKRAIATRGSPLGASTFRALTRLGPGALEWLKLHVSELNGVRDEQIKQRHVIEEYDEAAETWRIVFPDPDGN